MFHHFIIMASLDSKGTRIAYHYVFEKEINDKRIEDDLLNIKNALGCISSISTHSLCLDSDTWEDVILYDPFFEEVYRVHSLEEFIKLTRSDLELTRLN